MKVTAVETVRPARHGNVCFVQLHTDEGLIGHGETFFGAAGCRGARCAMSSLPYTWGADPLRIERHAMSLRGFVGSRDPAVELRAATPVVLVDEPARTGTCSVAVDDRRGGEIAGQHLLTTGRRRIAYVTGPESVRQCVDRGTGLRGRLGCRTSAARRHGRADRRTAGARPGTRRSRTVLATRPDAVFCANDVVALGVLRGLLEAGVRVPDDVALVGYYDI